MEERAKRQETITEDNKEIEARERRERRMQEMQRRQREQQELRRKIQIGAPIVAGALILCIVAGVGISTLVNASVSKKKQDAELSDHAVHEAETSDEKQEKETLPAGKLETGGIAAASVLSAQSTGIPTETGNRTINEILQGIIPPMAYSANATGDTLLLGENFPSEYAIFVDLDSQTILAQKSANVRINPASMTKILTVLVAAEHLDDLDDTFMITHDIIDYAYSNDCSIVGFAENEYVTVADLLYGTILPSGADAALGLAEYVAGSHEAFVELMNQKLEELGLSGTAHMTNCVGLYDENHYCTTYDMAMIMEAALNDELCKKVMSTRIYTTSSTNRHPNGIQISNWFLRRIEDQDTGGVVLCAKTGYVRQSGNCAVSYGIDHNGKEYVCVTANANSSWRCIYDHAELYKRFST